MAAAAGVPSQDSASVAAALWSEGVRLLLRDILKLFVNEVK